MQHSIQECSNVEYSGRRPFILKYTYIFYLRVALIWNIWKFESSGVTVLRNCQCSAPNEESMWMQTKHLIIILSMKNNNKKINNCLVIPTTGIRYEKCVGPTTTVISFRPTSHNSFFKNLRSRMGWATFCQLQHVFRYPDLDWGMF